MHYSEPSSGENYFLHNKYSCRLFRFVMGEEENRMRGIIGFFYHGSGHSCWHMIHMKTFCQDERCRLVLSITFNCFKIIQLNRLNTSKVLIYVVALIFALLAISSKLYRLRFQFIRPCTPSLIIFLYYSVYHFQAPQSGTRSSSNSFPAVAETGWDQDAVQDGGLPAIISPNYDI